MAGGISLNIDQTPTPQSKPLAFFQPTSPFSPPELRQPPPSVAGGIVNGQLQAQSVQNSVNSLFGALGPAGNPTQGGPASPLLSSAIGLGVTTLQNPSTPPSLTTPPAPAQIGNIDNPTPPQNPTLPPSADLAVVAAQQAPDITGTFAANVASFQQLASDSAVATGTINAAVVSGTPAPQAAPAQPAATQPQAAPQPADGTSPLSTQGLAYSHTLQLQQDQSHITSDANQAREEQIRADAQRAALQAELDVARAAAAQRQIQLAQSQAASIQSAASVAAATVNAVAASASVPGGPAVLTVSDAGGNVLFRRVATDAEVAAAQAAADAALREAHAALARLALDQAIAGQPLGLDPPKGDIRTVDPRVTAEFNATNTNVQLPVPELPAFVVGGQVPDFVTHGDLPAFDSPILPTAAPAPPSPPPHQAA